VHAPGSKLLITRVVTDVFAGQPVSGYPCALAWSPPRSGTCENGVHKVTYRDPDGHEISARRRFGADV